MARHRHGSHPCRLRRYDFPPSRARRKRWRPSRRTFPSTVSPSPPPAPGQTSFRAESMCSWRNAGSMNAPSPSHRSPIVSGNRSLSAQPSRPWATATIARTVPRAPHATGQLTGIYGAPYRPADSAGLHWIFPLQDEGSKRGRGRGHAAARGVRPAGSGALKRRSCSRLGMRPRAFATLSTSTVATTYPAPSPPSASTSPHGETMSEWP